jgi:hypothetical protein
MARGRSRAIAIKQHFERASGRAWRAPLARLRARKGPREIALPRAHPQPITKSIPVDKPVRYPEDCWWVARRTGYAEVLPIGDFFDFSLISGTWRDRSPIHSLYDYE